MLVELSKDVRDLFELLNRHQVRYLTAGVFALALRGVPRYTNDLDIWIEESPTNAARLVTAIEEFGFASLGLRVEDFLDPDIVIQLGYVPSRVDFFTRLIGAEFADVYPARTLITIQGIEVFVIDRELEERRLMIARRARPWLVREVRRSELDAQAERRAYWASRTPAARIAEIESLRRPRIDVTGDPDPPILRVVHRRRSGEPVVEPPW